MVNTQLKSGGRILVEQIIRLKTALLRKAI